MIGKLATCTRCGRVIYLAEEVGVRWTADLEPLDAQEAIQALVAGRQVYRVTQPGPNLSTARPAVLKALREAPVGERPLVVASHGCPTGTAKALHAVLPAPEEVGGPGAPKAPAGPSGARTARTSGRATGSSGAPNAENRPSDPTCEACGVKIADGEQMVGIQLGELYVYAAHADRCG